MNISDRLIEYLDYKGISKNKFYKKTGLSNGFLTSRPNISSDKIEIIINYYPEINLNWLVTGEGSMLNNGETVANGHHNVGNIVANGKNNTISINGEQFTEKALQLQIKGMTREIQHLRREIENHKEIIKTKDQIIQLLQEKCNK